VNFNIGTRYLSREKCILQRLYVPGLELEPGNGVALMAMMDCFDHLFEADGDEQADDDRDDVNEEVPPSAGGVMSGMDVEHVSLRTGSGALEKFFLCEA
jgi:hypothetical protein